MILNETIFKHLLQTTKPGPKLSIYLPTHPASTSQTMNQDKIRFKNSLKEIESDKNYDESKLAKTMKALEELINDTEFWQHQAPGLAIFADSDGYEAVSLIYEATEANYVDEKYLVSPLAAMLSLSSSYYVLEINHKRPRLLSDNAMVCEEVELKDMPGSFEDMFGNVEYNKQLQHQSTGTGTFHGHTDEGAIEDDALNYYRKIAKVVDKHLKDKTEPLLMVGVEERVAAMRKQLKYKNVLDEYVEVSSTAMNEQTLHDITTPVVDELNAVHRQEVVEEFEASDSSKTAKGQEEIGKAIAEHRVEKLIFQGFRQTADTVRGGYDARIVLQLSDYSQETEELVREVILQGGSIVAVDEGIFEDDKPRAICRF